METKINILMKGTGKTLATAESCTGGGIAARIVSVPGASDYYKGGIVSYTNEVKIKLLEVSPKVLEEQTAVCEDVARQMALGACKTIGSDYAVAITGLAGPGGGTPGIPVGTIWIGYGKVNDIHSFKIQNDAGRTQNLENAKDKALELIYDYIKEDLQKNA